MMNFFATTNFSYTIKEKENNIMHIIWKKLIIILNFRGGFFSNNVKLNLFT